MEEADKSIINKVRSRVGEEGQTQELGVFRTVSLIVCKLFTPFLYTFNSI
jgi:hypothetical protein